MLLKKQIAFCSFFLLLFTGLAHAQGGFSVAATVGGGGSGLLTGGGSGNNSGNSSGSDPMAVMAKLDVGYRTGRFSVITGLQYFTSGFDRYNNLNVWPEPQPLLQSLTFRNIMIPASLQLHMPMGQWFELIPSAGLAMSYTGHATYEVANPLPDRKILSADEFNQMFRRFNVWGTLGLHLACSFNERMALLGGFDMMATINGIEKEILGNTEATRLLAGSVNLGFRYKLYY